MINSKPNVQVSQLNHAKLSKHTQSSSFLAHLPPPIHTAKFVSYQMTRRWERVKCISPCITVLMLVS